MFSISNRYRRNVKFVSNYWIRLNGFRLKCKL